MRRKNRSVPFLIAFVLILSFFSIGVKASSKPYFNDNPSKVAIVTHSEIDISGKASSYKDIAGRFAASTPEVITFLDNKNQINVAYIDENNLLIYKYDSDDLSLVKKIQIEARLPKFGNIICDKNGYYYVVWGQDDPGNGIKRVEAEEPGYYYEDYGTDCDTIIVSKYNSNGVLQKELPINGLYNINGTRKPFYSGNCSMAIDDGVLAIIYARLMYNTHQSNTIEYVNCDTMERLEGDTDYTSHSFDQRIYAISEGGFIDLNHGDALYRCFSLARIKNLRQRGGTVLFHFREGANRDHGYNETFAQMGGMAELNDAYVFAASSERLLSVEPAPSSSFCGHNDARDLFLIFRKKDFSDFVVEGETRKAEGKRPDNAKTELFLSGNDEDKGIVWMTSYDSDHYVANPKIVAIDESHIGILWEKRSYPINWYDKEEIVTYYAEMDVNGNITMDAIRVPDCYLAADVDPVFLNGKIYWATKDDNGALLNCLTCGSSLDKYKVEHYKQELNGSYSNPFEIELCYGKAGDKSTPEVKQYVGFKSPITQTTTIAEDGKTVVKYYYPRKTYNLKWNFDGGITSSDYTSGKVKYEETISEPIVSKEGFVFDGWDIDVPSKMPANDLKIKAKWKEDNNNSSTNSQDLLVREFVTRFYSIILGRQEIREDEIDYYADILMSGSKTGAEIAEGFVHSPEFINQGNSNVEYVNKMYSAFFDRDGGDGVDYWVDLLEQGYSRDFVLSGFTNSKEFGELCNKFGIERGELPRGNEQPNPQPQPQPHVDRLNIDASNVDPVKLDEYIDRLYRLVLKREPEAEGKQYWREEIIKGNPYNASTAAEIGFFNSPEYLAMNKTDEEFIMDCYLVFLNREAEASGFEYWKEKFRTGEYDRQKLIEVGVGHSNEFKDILRSYGFVIIE